MLEAYPAEGRPGEPLVICGVLRGGRQVRVTLSDPGSWYSWPEDIDEFTTYLYLLQTYPDGARIEVYDLP